MNAFQTLMRGWAQLAPYNFIHALRLEQPAGVERWHAATAAALRTLELETTSLAIETPATPIEAHLEAELHRAFAPGALPLRFFVVEANGGGHWFGVVVDHWFADDFSCRAMLRRIYSSYQPDGATADKADLFLAQKQAPRRNWMVEWSSFLQQAASLQRASRLPVNECLDFTVGVFRTELPAGTLEVARTIAKEQNATVHDVFLAAAAQASAAAHFWPAGDGRDAIALASAMDLRRFESGSARDGFGLLISQFTLVERRPEKVSLPELVARIAPKTRRLKKVSGRAVFIAGLFSWRLARSRRAKATLYQRGSPFAAGLSNVNLSGSWIEQSEIAEFRRVGPTGPVVPLVLMLTTLRDRIFVDTTYRTTAFSLEAAENLVEDMGRRLMNR